MLLGVKCAFVGVMKEYFKKCSRSVTFISRLMHSIIQNVDIKIFSLGATAP